MLARTSLSVENSFAPKTHGPLVKWNTWDPPSWQLGKQYLREKQHAFFYMPFISICRFKSFSLLKERERKIEREREREKRERVWIEVERGSVCVFVCVREREREKGGGNGERVTEKHRPHANHLESATWNWRKELLFLLLHSPSSQRFVLQWVMRRFLNLRLSHKTTNYNICRHKYVFVIFGGFFLERCPVSFLDICDKLPTFK